MIRLGGNVKLLCRLSELFDQDARVLMRQLLVAVETNHVEDLIHAAHTMKSLASNLDAIHSPKLAQEIEHLALHGKLEELGNLPTRLEHMVQMELQQLPVEIAEICEQHTKK